MCVKFFGYTECPSCPEWSNQYLANNNILNGMGFLPDTQNCGLRMRRECRERFHRHRLQRKPLVSDPDMHHGTCATHVPWCMSGSLTRDGVENIPGIPGACATPNFTYLARGPWILMTLYSWDHYHDAPQHEGNTRAKYSGRVFMEINVVDPKLCICNTFHELCLQNWGHFVRHQGVDAWRSLPQSW